MGWDNQGSSGNRLRRPRLQTVVGIPFDLPVFTSYSTICHSLLPSERRHVRKHLPGHLERKVVGPLRRQIHSPFYSESPRRTKHLESPEHHGFRPVAEPGNVQEPPPRKVPFCRQTALRRQTVGYLRPPSLSLVPEVASKENRALVLPYPSFLLLLFIHSFIHSLIHPFIIVVLTHLLHLLFLNYFRHGFKSHFRIESLKNGKI